MRILIAEDDRDLNRVLVRKLTEDGHNIDSCFDGVSALDYVSCSEYDLLLLDIMMPQLDGLAVLREMKKKSIITPVIFLTAKDGISDRVLGLDLGAADYIIKPFSFAELSARIRAAVRKSDNNSSNIYSVADLCLDTSKKTVTRNGKLIELSSKEYSLLEYMIRNKGTVLSRVQIETNVWNADYEGGTNVVDVYIRYLRKKIDDGAEIKLIHTVRGSGYVLRDGS